MTPITFGVGREAEGADMGYFIFDSGYRERVSDSTNRIAFDTDTVSFAIGLFVGGKLDISISESKDFLIKTSGSIGRGIENLSRTVGKLFND